MAQYTRISGSVGLITLKNPPVNALSAVVRQGIVDSVERALGEPEVKCLVICGQSGKFCGGADIREFGKKMTGPPLIPVFHAIEAAAKPVVAAIEGIALGGGLELALGCHYRIAHSKAKLGLPEVTLGLLPAAAGSQRLPRLIGVPAALDLITTGRHVTAAEALQLGIVDQVTDHNTVDAAVKFALSVAGEIHEKEKELKVLTGIKTLSERKRNSSWSGYFRRVRHQDVPTCRLWKSKEAENTAARSSTIAAINVSWLCQMCSDVFTAFAVLFRRAKRDKLS